MNLLDDFERLKLAVDLLRREARVSIVHHETGVSRPKLRHLYRELHGRGASCGQIPAIGGVAEHPAPIDLSSHEAQLFRREPRSVQATDDAAHARSGDRVNRDPGLLEYLEHADVRESTGGTAT